MSSLKRKDKITCENCGTQTRKSICDSIRRDVQLGHFTLVSVPISQQLPRLTCLLFQFSQMTVET